MPERTVDFVVTSQPPTPAGPIPAGQEAISFSYGIAAGQDSTIVVHHDQVGRIVTLLAPYGLGVTLSGYMANLPEWVSLRVVDIPERGHPFPAHQDHSYLVLVNALHHAGFRETIHPRFE